jgi:16S rRNA (guanine966-N2)-methyltransferase
VRVIAGNFGSRPLRTLRGTALRPTSDRLRETLFNILGTAIENCVFVDVFAGTGAVGIEALSRYARQVIFIEKHGAASALIRENLRSLGISAGAEILNMDALRGLQELVTREIHPDLIFLDPPYSRDMDYVRVIEFADNPGFLRPGGIVIAEHSSKVEIPLPTKLLKRVRIVKQGDSALSFYTLQIAD